MVVPSVSIISLRLRMQENTYRYGDGSLFEFRILNSFIIFIYLINVDLLTVG
jgi:hypothetical protein